MDDTNHVLSQKDTCVSTILAKFVLKHYYASYEKLNLENAIQSNLCNCSLILLASSNIFLTIIYSDLSKDAPISIFLESVQKCVKYISTYQISEIDNKFFQKVLPPLKCVLLKTFDENFLLTDTCDDEFVATTLKENLKVVINLLQILKEILEFLNEITEISISDIKSIIVTSAEIISSSYDHCKNSSTAYKNDLNQDALELFKVIQDIHCLYFKLFESCIIEADISKNDETIKLFKEVLENLYKISDILFSLNIILFVKNWKGYLAILQKFLNIINNHIDLKTHIDNLTNKIYEILSSLNNLDPDSLQSITNNIKVSGFLVRVVLKIFNIFWDDRNKIMDEGIQFCCMIYGFSTHNSSVMEYPAEVISLMEDQMFAHLKAFVSRFLKEEHFIEAVSNKTLLSENYCFGFLNMLNFCMEFIATNENLPNCDLEILIRLVFDCTKLCFEQFLWPDSIFDDLVVNVTAAIMSNGKYYKKIEPILLENILQEEIWNYFLAVEIWCLLLRNASPSFCVDTLKNLIKINNQLEFGINTFRLENFYLKHFIQRVYGILPDYLKCQVVQSVYVQEKFWKNMDFQHFPKQFKNIIADLQQISLEKLKNMATDDFTSKDFIILVHNLESLSSVNFQDMCIDPINLVNAIEHFWELSFTDTDNNVFRYFIVKLFKITSALTMEFNNKQLCTVLQKLIHLSPDECLETEICLLLASFCHLNLNQLGQNGSKIITMISNVLTYLLRNSNNIVKQAALEVLEMFAQHGKQVVAKDVIMNCADMQTVISDYLQKRVISTKFDTEYIKNVGRLEYKHNCVKWKDIPLDSGCKRIKLDIFDNTEKTVEQSREPNILKEMVNKYKLKEIRYKPYRNKNKFTEEMEVKEVDSVNEVLMRLKGEVKCLMNVTKSERLTAKNVSDLKIITNQLMSLM